MFQGYLYKLNLSNLKRPHDCSLLNSLRDICALLSTAMVERMLLLVHFIQLG